MFLDILLECYIDIYNEGFDNVLLMYFGVFLNFGIFRIFIELEFLFIVSYKFEVLFFIIIE